jgi:hypothetical protein
VTISAQASDLSSKAPSSFEPDEMHTVAHVGQDLKYLAVHGRHVVSSV